MNKKSLKFFENLSKKNKSQASVKLAKHTDNTFIDAQFILKYANKDSKILDLGSGTGLIVNKIQDKVAKMVCIEPYKEFSKFIIAKDNIIVENCNVFDYKTDEKFDLITMFGFMHYFNEEEAVKIYKIYKSNLKFNGKIIIKNQFGIKEDINVSGYSEEQQTDYYAQYRYIKKEQQILEDIGYKNIEVVDIYPPEANRWDNTHFYAIVAETY